ncbi:tRNA (uracil-O(2)-)-methyltransferase [Fonsecaea pedrosoi]|nr:tRNA (uracil-O(2)-)-methyltransferase [Fonsecaea pedrosoi]
MASDTLQVQDAHQEWKTAPEYSESCSLSADRFQQVTDLLLENPNLNSTHLFRADILYDSAHRLKTVSEKEKFCQHPGRGPSDEDEEQAADEDDPERTSSAPVFEGATLQRKVLRKLIPRKPQLDRPLDQWCYIYSLDQRTGEESSGCIVVYDPQVDAEADMPWYHPPVKSLAYFHKEKGTQTTLSVHFLPFPTTPDPLPPRTHRTFVSLLQTFLRLAKNPTAERAITESGHRTPDGKDSTGLSLAPSALKDTILPQHIVQDTYTRLKEQYAGDLISRWAEQTEPSKHVFEDLAIAAFVIELWKRMYPQAHTFPGFVDIACGNGLLTYVLIKEGYQGRGFDARRRKTWDVLEMDSHLDEMLCIPQPFLDHLNAEDIDRFREAGGRIHDGVFEAGTFIISNHADELTPWTPLLATLSSPNSPLPFLAIPCCSHALSGAKHRYTTKDATFASSSSATTTSAISSNNNHAEEQPASGDLKALRAAKAKAANHTDDTSMYACLTKKVVSLAQEVGIDVELTLMRIPSTRNIGVVGNRRRASPTTTATRSSPSTSATTYAAAAHPGVDATSVNHVDPAVAADANASLVQTTLQALLHRECAVSGGIAAAATCWVDRARKLQTGQGRGKVNHRGRQPCATGMR